MQRHKHEDKISYIEYYNPRLNPVNIQEEVSLTVKEILKDGWGFFPDLFVNKHILNSKKIIFAFIGGKGVGFCALSELKIKDRKINYVEFLVIKKQYQNQKIGSRLYFATIKREIFSNILKMLLGGDIEFFFITPNIRILCTAAQKAKFIYPDPFATDLGGRISPADDETWEIAQNVLRNSDNPSRRLDREGLVLHDSYRDMPWLRYNVDTAPWHKNPAVNLFARKYLGYHSGEDREFMVRLKVNFISIFKYFLS